MRMALLNDCWPGLRNDQYGRDEKVQEYFHTALRCLVFFCLVACLLTFGIFSYMLMWNSEDKIFRENFLSISQEFSEKTISLVNTVAMDGGTLSSLQSVFYPFSSQWPYAYINGFVTVASTVKASAPPFGGAYVMPIVYPDQVSSFETYIQQQYAEDMNIPSTAATYDFGFGISATNTTTGERYHDVMGGGSASGDNSFLTPMMSYFDYYNTENHLWNVYDDYPLATKCIDGVYACIQAGNTSCQAIMETDTTGPIPGTLIVTPIIPRDDPHAIVGFVVTAFTWNIVLGEGVANLANGMQLVISTSDQDQFTARFEDGSVIIEGLGDLHDKEYGILNHDTTFKIKDTQAAASVTYHLNLYSTKAFYDKFHTNLPIRTTTLTVVMILATALFFVLYDRFVKKDNVTNTLLLQGKRKFVRFVSHEIRTPLNAAMVGLQLMDDRIMEQLKIQELDGPTHETIMELHSLSAEVRMNADVALTVLNDLLQYDKIEIGTMKLEVGIVDVWSLAIDCVQLFSGQVQHAGINLHIRDPLTDPSLSEGLQNLIGSLHVKGDGIRLAQAFRNIVSNALKFSKRDDTVDVTLEWREYGLFGVKIPTLPPGHVAAECPIFRRGSFVLTVTDHGPGMAVEQVGKLFSEGVQFQPNKLQAGGGSGLGLFISKGIVDMHGGVITAASDGYGSGSTFCIELPLCGNEEGPPPPSMEPFAALSALKSGHTKVFPGDGHKDYSPLHVYVDGDVDDNGHDDTVKMFVDVERGEGNGGGIELNGDMSELRSFSSHGLASVDGSPPGSMRVSSLSGGISVSGHEMSAHGAGGRFGRSSSIHSDKSSRGRSTPPPTELRTPRARNVLIVDDAPRNRSLLGCQLERRGYHCDYAEDGLRCLAMLSDNNLGYDLILMDSEMPNMKATQIIREKYGSRLIIIGLTGNVMPVDVKHFIEHGADAVLSIPLEMNDFVVLVEELETSKMNL